MPGLLTGFASGRPAVMHDATMERRWGEITLVFVEVQIRSGLSVPAEQEISNAETPQPHA